jgi:hypothetical protein
MKQWENKDVGRMFQSVMHRLQLIEWRQQQLQLKTAQQRREQQRHNSDQLESEFKKKLEQAPVTDKQQAQQPEQNTDPVQQVNRPISKVDNLTYTRSIHALRLQSMPEYQLSLDQLVRPKTANDISACTTVRMPAVRLPIVNPVTPLPIVPARPTPPQQIFEVGPERLEHRLHPGKIEPLKDRMLALVLYFSCRYDRVPDQILLSPRIYRNILPFTRSDERYEFGFPIYNYPLDDPQQRIVRYVEDPKLDDETIACAMSDKATNKFPAV